MSASVSTATIILSQVERTSKAVHFSDECFRNSRCRSCQEKVTRTHLYAYHLPSDDECQEDYPEITCIYHINCLASLLRDESSPLIKCTRFDECSTYLNSKTLRIFVSPRYFHNNFLPYATMKRIFDVESAAIKTLSDDEHKSPDQSPQDVKCTRCNVVVPKSDMHAYHLGSDSQIPSKICIYHIKCLAEFLKDKKERRCFSDECSDLLKRGTVKFVISEKAFFRNFIKEMPLDRILKVEKKNELDHSANMVADAQAKSKIATFLPPDQIDDTKPSLKDSLPPDEADTSDDSISIFKFKKITALPEELSSLIAKHSKEVFCQACNAPLVSTNKFAYHEKDDGEFCFYHVDCVKGKLDGHETFFCDGCRKDCSEKNITVFYPSR